MVQELLDSLPIGGVFIAFALLAMILYEIGYRVGRWRQETTPEEIQGPTGMLVGSLLALMAFLLAITMGMASDRFDARRGFVQAEANSVGTTYLRTGYLPEPASSDSRDLLIEYVPLRIATFDLPTLAANMNRSVEIQDELWSIAEDLARATPESDLLALYVDSLNETIDMHSLRVTAGLHARVPETILLLLIAGSALTLGMVGYSAGLTRRRSLLTAVAMIIVLGAVLTLVIDIDRPAGGFVTTSQLPIILLEQQIVPPAP